VGGAGAGKSQIGQFDMAVATIDADTDSLTANGSGDVDDWPESVV